MERWGVGGEEPTRKTAERQTNEKRWRDEGVCGEKPARKTRGKQGEIES
jgi:hypothetical protein